MEEVQELPSHSTASSKVTQTLDHDLDAHLLEVLNEQSPHNSLNDTLKKDTERQHSRTDSYATVLQTTGEHSYEIADEVDIRSGAKIKSQPCSSNSSLRELREPTHTGNEPQSVPSTLSVPSEHPKEQSQTSMNEAYTMRSDTENTNDAEGDAGQEDAVHDASSHNVIFQLFHTELCIDFVVTPSGIFHKRDESLLRRDIRSLYEGFGQRINMMLECLPDRYISNYTLQSPRPLVPQTVLGFPPYYTADVQILVNFAHSAQEIIRDIGNSRGDPLASLIDFRPEDFLNALGPTVRLFEQRPFLVRIHELIEDFDRQCYDAVHRLRQCTSRKSSAYTHHATSSNSPPLQKDPSVSVPNQGHPPHMNFGGAGGRTSTTPGNQCFNFSGGSSGSDLGAVPAEHMKAPNEKDDDDISSQFISSVKKPLDRGRKRNADGSSSSKRDSAPSHGPKLPSIRRSETRPLDRREAQRSATYQPSPEAKPPSMRRSETMPVDRMRPGNPVPLKSSNLKNMKVHSDFSDSSSESDSEMTEDYHPLPRPPPSRKKNHICYLAWGSICCGTGYVSAIFGREPSNIRASIIGLSGRID